MLTEFILVSGWTFWIVVAAVAVLDVIILTNEDEVEGWAVFITAGTTLGAVLFTDAFAGARVSTLIAALIVYLALGAVWSLKKWYSFVVKTKRDLQQDYDRSVNKSAKGNETFESYAKNQRPTAAKHKSRIIGWMALWPFSVSWWVLTWPRRAFVWLYDRLSTLFDRISAKIWASA